MNIGDRIPEVLGIDQHGNEIKIIVDARLSSTLIRRQTQAVVLLKHVRYKHISRS